MEALESALRPVANVLNRNIQAHTPARELCLKLSGTVVAIRVRDTALAAYFIVHDDTLELRSSCDADPDVVLSGSVFSLARLAGQSGESAIREGFIDLSGDAETAQAFQQLLNFAKPDFEEELSTVVGDVAAHRLGTIARGLRRWSRDARATMGANISEYLQEESRETPSRFEVEELSSRIGVLRDDVERLEARLNRIQGNG